jgi:hypothetical protein
MKSGSEPTVRISVVISNHNYGHFLKQCIDSVLDQTLQPHDIIVVDDGSADGSLGILDQYAANSSILIIRQENQGQTAAINVGFASCTGNSILFLDADDRLRPHALETVARLWSDEDAVVCFPLAVIDALGEVVGAYRVPVTSGDMVPMLLRRGEVAHYPTSGNVFRRASIEHAFPLPAREWPISTDALLIRIAVLDGTLRVLDQELAEYRVHHSNNYFRAGLGDARIRERGLIDMVKSADALVFEPDAIREGRRGAPFRLAYALAQAKADLELVELSRQHADIARRMRILIKRMLSASALPRGRVRLALALLPLAISNRLSAGLARWACQRQARPGWVDATCRALIGDKLRRAMRAASEPLKAETVSGELSLGDAFARVARVLPAMDWEKAGTGDCFVMTSNPGHIVLGIPGNAGRTTVKLGISLPETGELDPVSARVMDERGVLGSTECHDEATISFTLPADEGYEDRTLHLALEVEFLSGQVGSLFKRWPRPVAKIVLQSLEVTVEPELSEGLTLVAGRRQRFADCAHALVRDPGALEWSDGVASIIANPTTLRIWVPNSRHGHVVTLGFADRQEPTWLDVFCESEHAFSGTALPGGEVRVPLPPSDMEAIDLLVCFHGVAGAESAVRLIPETIGIHPEPLTPSTAFRSDMVEAPKVLLPGTRLTCNEPAAIAAYLGSGWASNAETDSISLVALNGIIRFQRSPTDLQESDFRVAIQPSETALETGRAVLVVRMAGDVVHQSVMAGRTLVSVKLPRRRSSDAGIVEIELFAGVAAEDASEPLACDLECLSIEYEPDELPAGKGKPELQSAAELRPTWQRWLTGQSMETTFDSSARACAREDFIRFLETASDRAIDTLLLTPKLVATLITLAPAHHEARLKQPSFTATGSRTWLAAMVTGPAWRASISRQLGDLPPTFYHAPEPVVAWLMSPGGVLSGDADEARFHDHLLQMLEFARAALARECVGSTRFVFADQLVRHFQGRTLLFGQHNLRQLAQRFTVAQETSLLAQGIDLLSGPPPVRAGDGRLCVAVLMATLEANPETALLMGMYGQLDPGRFRVVVLAMKGGARAAEVAEVFPGTLFLNGISLEECVRVVENTGAHVLAVGSHTLGASRCNDIFARRLAPVRFVPSAVHPSTTGWGNDVHALSSRLFEPEGASEHYSEQLALWDDPAQVFDFGEAVRQVISNVPQSKPIERQRLGLPADGLLAVSGAYVEKIGDELLGAWTEILRRSPGTVIVLYPFAQNWSGKNDIDWFRQRLTRALSDAGLGSDRIIALEPMSQGKVLRLLAICDLYLDSFPYAGATTVIEALSCGCPVVTRSAPTQRGMQGCGWLRTLGLHAYATDTTNAYVACATGLLADDDARTRARSDVADALVRHADKLDPKSFGTRFGLWLESLATQARAWQPTRLPVGEALQDVRYVFHHMPKTAGSSMREVLRNHFRLHLDYRADWTDETGDKIDLASLGERDMLVGHFDHPQHLRIPNRYPELLINPRWRMFTIVRDPLERALSAYFHQKRLRGADWEFFGKTVSDFLCTENAQLAYHFDCDETNWRTVLDRYWFLGTQERIEQSLQWLADAWEIELAGPLPTENTSPRDEEPTAEALAVFARDNALDFKIYREIDRRLDEALKNRQNQQR